MCGSENNSIRQRLPMGLREALDAVEPHDHLCLIYETEEQWLNALEYFLAGGLRRNEKCFYIIDERSTVQVKEGLLSRGLDIAAAEKRGQFVVLNETETYTSGGSFDPDRMLATLKSETEKALAEGFSALRVTGEMSWALKGAPGSERLIEYEARLNTFFPHNRCCAVCQYDRRRFDADTLLGVLYTHPVAVVGDQVLDNFYYISPDDFLSGDRSAALLDRWIDNLRERNNREKLLAQAGERLDTAMKMGRLAWWSMDVPTGRVTFDDMKLVMLGYDPESFPDRHYSAFTGLVHPDDHGGVMAAMEGHLAGSREQYEADYRIRARSGDWVWFHDRGGVTRRGDGGEPLEVTGFVVDITGIKRAEEQIRRSERRYRGLFDELPVPLIEEDFSRVGELFNELRRGGVTDLNEYFAKNPGSPRRCLSLIGVREANRKALDLFGAASSAELAGRLPLVYNERMYDVLKGLLSALFKGETHYTGEPAGVVINGEKKHLLVMWTVVSGREDDLSELLAVRIDVTERFQSIEERRQERLSLERLAGGAVSAVSGQMLGLTSMRERASDVFDRLVERYCEALEGALEEKIYKTATGTSGKLRAMAEELGFLKAGPRDVVDIHAKALKIKSNDAPPSKAQAYAVEGRIVVLELMGFLAAYYRNYSAGVSKSS